MIRPPISIDEAEAALKDVLRARGVDLAHPQLLQTWAGFKEFVTQTPVRSSDDMVLFQIGVYRAVGRERFTLSFLRQFVMPEDDPEHDDEPIQLECEFVYGPTDELTQLGSYNRWSASDRSLEQFFATIAQLGYLDIASRNQPTMVRIEQLQV